MSVKWAKVRMRGKSEYADELSRQSMKAKSEYFEELRDELNEAARYVVAVKVGGQEREEIEVYTDMDPMSAARRLVAERDDVQLSDVRPLWYRLKD